MGSLTAPKNSTGTGTAVDLLKSRFHIGVIFALSYVKMRPPAVIMTHELRDGLLKSSWM